MSGPKYGCAKLDIKKLRELQDNLSKELEEKRIEILFKKISDVIEDTKKIMEENKIREYYTLLAEAQGVIPDSPDTALLKKQLRELELLTVEEFSMEGSSNQLIVTLYVYEERKSKVNELFGLMKIAAEAIRSEMGIMPPESEGYSLIDWKSVKKKSIIKKINSPVTDKYNELLLEAVGLQSFQELKQSLDSIVDNISTDEEYKLKQLEMRRESIRVEKEGKKGFKEQYALINDFQSLSAYLGDEVEIPCDVNELRKAVDSLRERADKRLTAEYTSKALHKVMEDIGYDIIGREVVSSENNNSEKNYYDFSENSALNVASSDNGTVLFEIMGKTENGELLSDTEKQLVKEDMDRFCPDFYKIRAELLKMGVILEQERHFEADVKYVRGIDLGSFEKSRRITNREKKGLDNE